MRSGAGGVARKETRGEARERAWGGSQLWREPRGELEGACSFKESREEGSGGAGSPGVTRGESLGAVLKEIGEGAQGDGQP